jgi:hypothetical protein
MLLEQRRIAACWSTDRHLGLTGVPLVVYSSPVSIKDIEVTGRGRVAGLNLGRARRLDTSSYYAII